MDRCVPGLLAGPVYAVAMAEVQGESRPFHVDSVRDFGGMPLGRGTPTASQKAVPRFTSCSKYEPETKSPANYPHGSA
jgi:hypothetical protein